MLAGVLLCLVAPASAAATEVSQVDFAGLASQAASDTAALEELRAVTSVGGVPVDIEAALAGAEGDDLDDRLQTLARSAESVGAGGIDAAEAREQVAGIFAGENPEPPPPPPSGDGSGGGVSLSAPSLPVALFIAVAVLFVAAVVASGMGRRTILEREAAAGLSKEPGKAGARNLGREADEAERRGDFAAAVRLRFQAGLVRLDEMGSIELRPSLTASGAARESGLAAIGTLASPYEEIAFGGREAAEADAERQRSGWKQVVDEARRR